MTGRRPGQPQHGAALLIFIILMVIGSLTYLVNSISPETIDMARQRKTVAALAEAREALIGFAIQYREQQNAIDIQAGNLPSNPVYGFLPLPDLGTQRNNNSLANTSCKDLEGCEAYNFLGNGTGFTVIGRLPWRMLGLPPLRDGSHECLWYAVSGSHQRNLPTTTALNWDTLGHLDGIVANTGTLAAEGLSGHDRPVALILAPGQALGTRSTSTSAVSECGGSYVVSEYLEGMALAPTFSSTNGASGNASAQPKPVGTRGKLNDATGTLLANDTGLAITSDMLFGAIRKSSRFRGDINQMIERIIECARDQIAAGGFGNALVSDACSTALDAFGPPGYYAAYRDQVFVTSCTSCQVTVDSVLSPSCAGALLFANQRGSGQYRRDASDKTDIANYLDGSNVTSYNANGNTYAGASQLLRESTTPPIQSKGQDIVRCIAPGATMTAATSALPAGSELSQYDPATRTITLGKANVESDQGYTANKLFGCVWQTDTHATGSGFRSYFHFNITDPGDGFTFAAIDGDRNTVNVCGAGEQHLGYSGNNGYTTAIAYPKIGVEVDTRRNYQSNAAFQPTGFNPARALNASTLLNLTNGRADPSYTGGHIGLVYWGSETPISTGYACNSGTCRAPSFCDTDNVCKLYQEEDDNVHGQLPTPPATRPPPQNPVAPTTPPTNPSYPPYGVDKLDPSLSSVPTNQDIHMRVETQRSYAGRDDTSRLVRLVAVTTLSSLSGLPTLDGTTVQSGDTLLVTAQADATTNGVYVASAGNWSRATHADEALELAPGTSWFVKEGASYTGSLWRLQNTEAPIMNVSPLTIQLFRAAVKTATSTAIASPPAGLTAIAGYTPVAGDRILLAGQTDARENGVWLANTGSWTRASPENAATGLRDGTLWYVSNGSQAGTYWWLNGDATPGTTSMAIAQATTNDLYAARVTTQVWKETSNANQIIRMKMTTGAMSDLDPVIRYGTCDTGTCPSSNPSGQSCGGTETDGHRYCYTGQKPKLYDSQKVYDTRGSACSSGASCATAGQFCGVDSYCYTPALRTARLGFTTSQSTQSQVISIGDFFTTWLP